MKSLTALFGCLWCLCLVAEAGPKIEFLGGSKKVVTVALTNKDQVPYYYHSQFVNELPYAIEVMQDGKTQAISERICGTDAIWNRLEPKACILIEIRLTAETSLPKAKAALLVFDRDDEKRSRIAGATIDMAEAIQFLRRAGLDKMDEPVFWADSFSPDAPSGAEKKKRANPESQSQQR